MAWSGAFASNALVAGTGSKVVRLVGAAASLAARLGAPAVGAADTGGLSTDQTPPANYTSLPNNFGGKAPGSWVLADLDSVEISIHDSDNAAQGAGGQTSLAGLVTRQIVVGDLDLIFHNQGGNATGVLDITIHYLG